MNDDRVITLRILRPLASLAHVYLGENLLVSYVRADCVRLLRDGFTRGRMN